MFPVWARCDHWDSSPAGRCGCSGRWRDAGACAGRRCLHYCSLEMPGRTQQQRIFLFSSSKYFAEPSQFWERPQKPKTWTYSILNFCLKLNNFTNNVQFCHTWVSCWSPFLPFSTCTSFSAIFSFNQCTFPPLSPFKIKIFHNLSCRRYQLENSCAWLSHPGDVEERGEERRKRFVPCKPE